MATRLEPISETLPGRYKSIYAKLSRQSSDFSFPGFLHGHSSFSRELGDGETLLNETMQPLEVLNYIKKYKIQEDSELGFYDATAYKLQQLVTKEPQQYSKLALEFKDLHKLFSYRLLWGIAEALKEKKVISWSEVLQLSEYIIKQNQAPRQGIIFYDLMRQLAVVYERGLSLKEIAPNFNERNRIWNILSGILRHAEAESSANDDRYSRGEVHSHQITINSTRGIILNAVMEYARWCNNNLQSTLSKGQRLLVTEVKDLLDRLLDPNLDNSIAVRSAIGYYIPLLTSLDKEWLKTNLPRIFPTDEPNRDLCYAAWDSYLLNNVWQELFVMLKPYYKHRVELLKTDKDRKIETDANRSVASHIAIAHINNIPGGKELFEEFIKNAPKQLVDHYVHFIGMALKENKEKKIPTLDLQAIREIWENDGLNSNPEFGWWL